MTHRLLFLVLFGIAAFSQTTAQGLFVRIGGGYGLPASGDDYGIRLVYDSTSLQSQSLIYGSNGQGAVFGLEVGYMINEHIGFQLGGEFLLGAKQTRSERTTPSSYGLDQESSNQIRLLPAVLISGGLGNIDPYCRVGVSVPLTTTTYRNNSATLDLSGTNSTVVSETEIVGKFVLGYSGALGCNFSIDSRFSIFAEVGALSQRLKASSGKLTLLEVDGVDDLLNLTTIQKEWNYLESVTTADNSIALNPDFNPNEPEDLQQISQNLSSFFLKAGVAINFGAP